MAFVIVGSIYDSAYDQLFEIYDNTVETFVGYIQEYGIEEELSEIYGKKLAKKILKVYENGEMRKITGIKKLKILKSIDEYFGTTNYFETENQLVVYELLV
jgi:6-phosphofructokinase